jgi:hypothetical protein
MRYTNYEITHLETIDLYTPVAYTFPVLLILEQLLNVIFTTYFDMIHFVIRCLNINFIDITNAYVCVLCNSFMPQQIFTCA